MLGVVFFLTGAALLFYGVKVLRKFRELVRVQKWSWPGIVSQAMLKHSAIFDPIRDEPEFIELLDFYESNAAEQRRLLQEMDEAT